MTGMMNFNLGPGGDGAASDDANIDEAIAPVPINNDRRPVLITGGAGFIGVNLADRLLRAGHRVIVLDNLSRQGVADNAKWLSDCHGSAVDLRIDDVRDESAVDLTVPEVSAIYHLAAQVAVTSSINDPRQDFEVNIRGTLNVLEAARRCSIPPPLLFTSTNKVYGDLRGLAVTVEGRRYRPTHFGVRTNGFAEGWLDFQSPYGCSKGAADQYVLDYARTYRLPATVFRMSCIYGPHQHGNEDQGWVAHFIIAAMQGRPITVYGDGCQVRDVLYVDDLTDAMNRALRDIEHTAGEAFNIGGGPNNAISLIEMLDLISSLPGAHVQVEQGPWRRCDQKYYVSDHGRFSRLTEWVPHVGVVQGVSRLHQWLTRAGSDHARRPIEVENV